METEKPEMGEQVNEELEELRREIAELKKTESLKNERRNPHFDDIDPAELKKEDLEIYKKIKKKTLTKEEFQKYLSNFKRRENFFTGAGDSRLNFAGLLVNLTSSSEWLEKWDKEGYQERLEAQEKFEAEETKDKD